VQQFAKKVLAGETTDLAGLISSKAKDWLKKLREGDATDSVTTHMEKLKTALTNAQITVEKQGKGFHVIVMEVGGDANNGSPAGNASYGGGGGGAKKRKPGKRVQFKVVKEHDKFVIIEVAVR